MTATMDSPAAAIAKPDGTVTFSARRDDLRLVKTPIYPIYGAGGMKVGEQPGEVVRFRNGSFTCPMTGTIALEDGRPADAAEVLAFLKAHRLNGNFEEGFIEAHAAVPAVSPEETEALVEAASTLDVEALRALILAEENGWNREQIIAPARRALERIEAALTQAAAEQAAPKAAAKATKAAGNDGQE